MVAQVTDSNKESATTMLKVWGVAEWSITSHYALVPTVTSFRALATSPRIFQCFSSETVKQYLTCHDLNYRIAGMYCQS